MINHITVNCSNLSEDILKLNLNLKFWKLMKSLCLTKMKNGMKVSNFAYLITKLHALTVSSLQHLSTTTLSLQHLNQY